jgi:hypothetical protein
VAQEPNTIQASTNYMQQSAHAFSEEINGQFRAEMRKPARKFKQTPGRSHAGPGALFSKLE